MAPKLLRSSWTCENRSKVSQLNFGAHQLNLYETGFQPIQSSNIFESTHEWSPLNLQHPGFLGAYRKLNPRQSILPMRSTEPFKIHNVDYLPGGLPISYPLAQHITRKNGQLKIQKPTASWVPENSATSRHQETAPLWAAAWRATPTSKHGRDMNKHLELFPEKIEIHQVRSKAFGVSWC